MDYIERYIKFREDNQYKGSLFYFEFKNNKEYRKANIENYKTAKKLGHDILVKEYLDELEKYGLLKVGIESSDLINIDFPPQ